MNPKSNCCGGNGTSHGCDSSISRRAVLQAIGAASVAMTGLPLTAMAGPFSREDFSRLVPEDKKLSADWIRSLYERGGPEVFRGDNLKWIGMPVGGICAGQLYLGGDGRLWHWDLFNQHVVTRADHYAEPVQPTSPLEQKFTLTIDGKARSLDREGFSDISFRGEYPIGVVEYRDQDVAVSLEAFSPFVPLNTDDSSLPATILRFTVKNTTPKATTVSLAGSVENGVAPGAAVARRNRIIVGDGLTFLECSAEQLPATPASPVTPASPASAPGKAVAAVDPSSGDGTMGLALAGPPAELTDAGKTVGSVGRAMKLDAGQSVTVTFVVTWHFPNLRIKDVADSGRHYATKFSSAHDVATYVVAQLDRLVEQTKLWRDTWYDSTLPYWFLDRTQLNTSILASSTCYRFSSGRFWAWEGVGCCPGTCSHVWHYAQAAARQFPELERVLREKTDFGLALQPSGAISFRGENNKLPAVDAQAGSILRALREHQMSPDDAFLRRIWPGVKRATQWLIDKDADGDGIIESGQHNTLDADWFGAVAWLSGLYVAALSAAADMADAMNDAAFAGKCRQIAAAGQKNITQQLFDGEYYINRIDPKHRDSINSGTGCEIDQVMGQSWAWQVGLPRVFPERETKSALRSLWKYNFTPDVGPYRKAYPAGRWYAMPGEAGLLMCSFPRKDWDYEQSRGKGKEWAAGYFNECMNGFEYQVAGHMIWEGLVEEGLAITRAVHDRYAPARRNPYNEVECGDHYARSMASYSVYLAACGFEYHGPRGHIGFFPRLSPVEFKAAYTSAESWGSFSQHDKDGSRSANIAVKYGRLRLTTVALAAPAEPGTVRVTLDGTPLPARSLFIDGRLTVTLDQTAVVNAGSGLSVTFDLKS